MGRRKLIENMSIQELSEHRERVDKILSMRRHQLKHETIEKATEIASAHGYKLKELFNNQGV